MTFLRPAILASCFVVALTSYSAPTQTHKPATRDFNVATSPDGLFEVRYPKSLVVCSHRDGENPDVWSPEECIADIPVCDNSGHAGEVMICLAYPAGEFEKSELQAAAFAVSRIGNIHSAGDCTKKWPRSNTSEIHSQRIGGLTFQAAVARESGNSHTVFANLYRIFHGGACYELDVSIALAQETAFAPEDAPRKLPAAERERMKGMLTQALAGFRFLK